MRRDRQMFPPRQLLHAATRGRGCIWFTKEREKSGERKERENFSVFPVLSSPPCPATSSRTPWFSGRKGEEEEVSLSSRHQPKGTPRKPRARGWSAPYLGRQQRHSPYVVKTSIDPGDKWEFARLVADQKVRFITWSNSPRDAFTVRLLSIISRGLVRITWPSAMRRSTSTDSRRRGVKSTDEIISDDTLCFHVPLNSDSSWKL